MAERYSGAVQQSLRAVAAWRLAAFVLTIGVVSMAVAAMHASSVQRTVLVPYGLISANGSVQVEGKPETDGTYLAILARADASTMLDWQPKTIKRQLNAFLTRLTPNAYGRYNLNLRNTAQKYSQMNVSESFYPNHIEYLPPFGVQVSGLLVRYAGDGSKQTQTTATYTFHYAISNGVYAIDSVETAK
jgi:TraE protein.